ncbi:DUF4435 domain-containing protein [Serratia sarumanii]|uniref:DUF4435 domain-containing protein n=1 Tax=Serratia sarumanii TaxID=3020826 RepID=UPI003F7ED597
MKYVLGEVLSQSIMTKTPTVVVEGIDDVKIYDSICRSAEKNCFVIPVECIDGYTEGNDHVIRAMNDIAHMPLSKYNYRDYILGVIDKDVRDFRQEMPINDLIFPLSVYSIESHFVNKECILYFIEEVTKATSDLVSQNLENVIVAEILRNFDDLFLFSLDALKGAIDPTYTSHLGYSSSEGRIVVESDITEIRKRRDALIDFAKDMRIDFNLETLKRISKGKWLLFLFCYQLEKVIKNLPSRCGGGEITSCRVCIADVEKCLYKIKEGINHKTMRNLLINKVHFSEIDYVRRRIRELIS